MPPSDSEIDGVTFSPDGNYIYYNAGTTANEFSVSSALYRVPTLGGSPARLLEDSGSPVKFSPDGQRMAFLRGNDFTRREISLMVANRDGTNLKALTVRKAPEHIEEIAWSPDGTTIACAIITTDAKSFYATIFGINVEDKVERPLLVSSGLGGQRWQEIADLIWVPGGKGLIVAAKDENASFTQLWEISFASGQSRRITNDLSDYLSVSVTGDAQALVTVQRQRLSNVWQVDPSRNEIPVTRGAGRYFDLSWTPDGKVLYASDSSGSADIWEMDRDGTGQKQLTSGAGRNYGPAASLDGRIQSFTRTGRARGTSGEWIAMAATSSS